MCWKSDALTMMVALFMNRLALVVNANIHYVSIAGDGSVYVRAENWPSQRLKSSSVQEMLLISISLPGSNDDVNELR